MSETSTTPATSSAVTIISEKYTMQPDSNAPYVKTDKSEMDHIFWSTTRVNKFIEIPEKLEDKVIIDTTVMHPILGKLKDKNVELYYYGVSLKKLVDFMASIDWSPSWKIFVHSCCRTMVMHHHLGSTTFTHVKDMQFSMCHGKINDRVPFSDLNGINAIENYDVKTVSIYGKAGSTKNKITIHDGWNVMVRELSKDTNIEIDHDGNGEFNIFTSEDMSLGHISELFDWICRSIKNPKKLTIKTFISDFSTPDGKNSDICTTDRSLAFGKARYTPINDAKLTHILAGEQFVEPKPEFTIIEGTEIMYGKIIQQLDKTFPGTSIDLQIKAYRNVPGLYFPGDTIVETYNHTLSVTGMFSETTIIELTPKEGSSKISNFIVLTEDFLKLKEVGDVCLATRVPILVKGDSILTKWSAISNE